MTSAQTRERHIAVDRSKEKCIERLVYQLANKRKLSSIMDRFLLLVCCIALISGSTKARPIRSIGNSHSDHGKVILGVRDITSSSATLDWSVPEDRPVLEFKISCKGHQALKSYDNIGSEDDSLTDELLEHNVPRDLNHFLINNLKPDYKYSCTLLAAELDGKLPHAWTKLIEPIHFSTLRISPDELSRTDAPEDSSVLDLLTFRQKHADKSAYIILGAGVPFGIAAIAAFVGICILCRKCNAYRKRKTDTYRQVNEDKLNRKLKGVVYNPMAMEYTTKWHQPSYLGPKSKNPQPKISHSGRHKGPQLDSRFDTGFNKPYGKLTIKELVQHLERLRRESPFAEDFKMNDPVSMRTKPASQSTSRTSSVGSGLSAESSSIQMKPVIPDMKLSTPVFEQPKKAKEVRKQDDKTTKTLGGLRASCTSRSRYSRPYTKPVLVQPSSVHQSSSGSSDDVILPRLPTHMRM